MARAKSTDRAEARRRYRAELAEAQAAAALEPDDFDGAGDSASQDHPAGPSAARGRSSSSPTTTREDHGRTAQPARPGFTSAIRGAARPWNLASDLAYIPDLVLHTRAVWIPALATVASGVYFAATYVPGSDNANGIAVFLLQLFVVPPTIAGPFLAGVLAPRATYIAGGIASLIGVLVFAVIVATVPVEGLTQGATPGTTAVALDRTSVVLQSLVISVPFGVLIGAAGGYYRRFLNLSGAGARRREEQRARQSRAAASRTPARRR